MFEPSEPAPAAVPPPPCHTTHPRCAAGARWACPRSPAPAAAPPPGCSRGAGAAGTGAARRPAGANRAARQTRRRARQSGCSAPAGGRHSREAACHNVTVRGNTRSVCQSSAHKHALPIHALATHPQLLQVGQLKAGGHQPRRLLRHTTQREGRVGSRAARALRGRCPPYGKQAERPTTRRPTSLSSSCSASAVNSRLHSRSCRRSAWPWGPGASGGMCGLLEPATARASRSRRWAKASAAEPGAKPSVRSASSASSSCCQGGRGGRRGGCSPPAGQEMWGTQQ
jgi:hypothetical protein